MFCFATSLNVAAEAYSTLKSAACESSICHTSFYFVEDERTKFLSLKHARINEVVLQEG